MPKIKYQDFNFRGDTLDVIKKANEIIVAYAAQGFDLTLRQLYYQFVARDLIKNKEREYKRLGSIINDGRMAGLIDWNRIVDRTRELRDLPHWGSPSDIIEQDAQVFRIERWLEQPYYCEVWIEKDALVGVIEGVCHEYDLPHFSCRGYTSQSEMWAASQRLLKRIKRGKKIVIFHLGDHDPSGIDMTRDIEDRLRTFTGGNVEVRRLALNMEQVEEYEPPPNPAKTTDARFNAYQDEHGEESWELDALEPSVIADLIREEIKTVLDEDEWEHATDEETEHKETLSKIADRFDDVEGFLNGSIPSEGA